MAIMGSGNGKRRRRRRHHQHLLGRPRKERIAPPQTGLSTSSGFPRGAEDASGIPKHGGWVERARRARAAGALSQPGCLRGTLSRSRGSPGTLRGTLAHRISGGALAAPGILSRSRGVTRDSPRESRAAVVSPGTLRGTLAQPGCHQGLSAG
eukprot:gene16934-biopygen5519